MIKIGARQNYKTTRLLRRLSTSNDHARHRATIDSRRVVQSPLRDSDSARRDRPTALVALIGRIPNRHPTHVGNRPPASKSP
jgi:hypothetical protein